MGDLCVQQCLIQRNDLMLQITMEEASASETADRSALEILKMVGLTTAKEPMAVYCELALSNVENGTSRRRTRFAIYKRAGPRSLYKRPCHPRVAAFRGAEGIIPGTSASSKMQSVGAATSGAIRPASAGCLSRPSLCCYQLLGIKSDESDMKSVMQFHKGSQKEL